MALGSAYQFGTYLRAMLPVLLLLGMATPPGPPTGSFGPSISYEVGRQPRALTLADVNGDGLPDIITANEDRSRTPRGGGGDNYAIGVGALLPRIERSARAKSKDLGSITVLLGQPDGSFRRTKDFAIGPYPTTLAVADMNHDGRPDLVVTCIATEYTYGQRLDNLLVLPALPGSGFGPPAAYRTAYQRTAELLALADLNADGWPDALTIGDGSRSDGVSKPAGMQVRLNQRAPAGTLGPDSVYSVGPHYSARSLVLADITGDGHPDALVTNGQGYHPDSTVVLLPGRAGGRFGPPHEYAAVLGPTAVADLNGDGHSDLVATSAHTLVVRLGGPQGLGPATRQPGTGRPFYTAQLRDVNGDNRPDLVGLYYPATLDVPGEVVVLPGQTGNHFGPPISFQLGTYAVEHFALGDLNRDGRPDLVVLDRNRNSVSVLLGR
jgi:hypothetical protein